MDPRHINVADYTYLLPEERIAKYPLKERDASKLLIYKEGAISEDIYRNIALHVPSGSMLVFNSTKVIPARIIFNTATGAKIEIFCLEPAIDGMNFSTALKQKSNCIWICMVRNATKWKDEALTIQSPTITLKATLIEKHNDTFYVRFEWSQEHLSFAKVLDAVGKIPLPPYLKREAEPSDKKNYQTLYAHTKGSVAAPTAGLHFTEATVHTLRKKNCTTEEIVLHVGAGTFKPVKTDTLEKHDMHAEEFVVSLKFIHKLIAHLYDRLPVIAVGTTSLRTLESLYWMGVLAAMNEKLTLRELEIRQWDAYHIPTKLTALQALSNLSSWMRLNQLETLTAHTQILIAPPYKLRMCNALITNFHQPNSTLLLLVAAVIGNDWKKVYQYALENDFRFLSYGDGSLLFAR